ARQLAHPAELPSVVAPGHTPVPIGAEYPQGSPAPDPVGDAALMDSVSDMIEGAFKVGQPLVIGATLAAPVRSLLTIGTTLLAQPTATRAFQATAHAGIHAPVEILDSGTPSTVELPPGSGPPETLTDIIRTALAPEPPPLKVGEGPDRAAALNETPVAEPPS